MKLTGTGYGNWKDLKQIGCTEKFIRVIIREFHEGMKGQVLDCGELSDLFCVSNGTKQGCVYGGHEIHTHVQEIVLSGGHHIIIWWPLYS